jgi:threonine dehydratase
MSIDRARSEEPSLALIDEVRPLVARHVRRTPLLRSEWLSRETGGEVFLKCENLQLLGSFKVRGGIAAVARLSDEERRRGVLASSAGNHGQGLAYAGRVFGVACAIAVPRDVPRVKEEAIRALGARVFKSPFDGYDDTQAWTLEHAEELGGGVFVSPYESAPVVAGNGGTLAIEVLEEIPDLDTLIIPCGGGGCAIGAGIVAHGRYPHARVVGVNTDASPGMWLSRRDGRAHERVQSRPTIADGIEGGVGERSFQLAERTLDEVVLAKESTIRAAVPAILRKEHMLVEGAGAAGVAALLDGRVSGRRMAIVLTGANIDLPRLAELLGEGQVP